MAESTGKHRADDSKARKRRAVIEQVAYGRGLKSAQARAQKAVADSEKTEKTEKG